MATVSNFSQPVILSEVSTPTAPDSGYLKVYANSGVLRSIANGGSEKTYATSSDLSAYLPLVGGTLTGGLTINSGGLTIKDGATNVFTYNAAGSAFDIKPPAYGFMFNASGTQGFFAYEYYASNTFTFADKNITKVNSLTLSQQSGTGYLAIGGSAGLTYLYSGSQNIFQQRNSTNAQAYQLYNTYASSTSFENLQFKANTGSAYQIGSIKGSAGGSNRTIQFGHFDAAGTFTEAMSVNTDGTFGSSLFKTFYINNIHSPYTDQGVTISTGASGSGGTSGTSIIVGTPYVGTRQFRIRYDATQVFGLSETQGNATFSPIAATSGSPTVFTITGAAHTTLSTAEVTDGYFNAARTVQFGSSGGTIASQRTWRFTAPTFTAASATTLTTASTVSISGPPVASTNITATNAYALNVESGDVKVNGNVHCSIIALAGATPYSAISLPNNYDLSWGGVGILFGSSLAGITLNNFPMQGITNLSARDISAVNGTTSTALKAHGTWTSTTSYERINIKGKASANFEIGPENGSAGGTLRGLTLGGYSAGSSTITPWLTFTSAGAATFNVGSLIVDAGGSGIITKQSNIFLDSWATHSGLLFRRAEGTSGSPTQITNNKLLGFFATYGYHSGAAYHTAQGCAVSFYSTENYTATAQGTKMLFGTTPNGTTTLTTCLTLDQDQIATFSKLVGQESAEITSTPSGTTQTITLNNGNHQTLTLTSSTGNVTVTLTVPSHVSAGTLIIKQHGTTPRDITWAVSSGTITWMGTEPTWASDAVNDVRIVSWRWNGSVMYLASTDVGT